MVREQMVRVLLVAKNHHDFITVQNFLSRNREQKYEVLWNSSFESGLKVLMKNSLDVALIDSDLGDRTGIDLLREAIALRCRVPIILLVQPRTDGDLEAMRMGAADYIEKDQLGSSSLEKAIRYAVHRAIAVKEFFDREAQIMMQDRLASVGLLASSIAHEIGTPLGVIQGRAEYLLMHSDSELCDSKQNLTIIVAQIERVAKLIQSLMSLARDEQIHHAGRASLPQAVQEVLDVMSPLLLKWNIQVTNEMIESVSVPVRANAGPLHQVIFNLLLNSVHAIETAILGGRKDDHSIRISGVGAERQYILSIEDTGCGISKSNLTNLFKPFFTTKDIGVGTGLGLATSYRIIESWGGAIGVKSQENVGSQFQIFLPIEAEER